MPAKQAKQVNISNKNQTLNQSPTFPGINAAKLLVSGSYLTQISQITALSPVAPI